MITGIINLLKPPGMTSHDAVAVVRRKYGQKQVGHAGTLDPAAAGVLPIFLGRATRLVEYLENADKHYRVELRFGEETDSGDDTGIVIKTSNHVPLPQQVAQALSTFIGSIEQIPPMHSAIKVGGKKLYELARQGITIERKPRQIVIYNASLVSMADVTAVIDVHCSKGTYIRSFCIDLGSYLGSAAVMTFLLRTKVGCFSIEQAVSLEELDSFPERVVSAPDHVLQHFKAVHLNAQETNNFMVGQKLLRTDLVDGTYRVYADNGVFIGIALYSQALLKPHKVFPID